MEKVKIDIISGFLGAGKTTFIKKLMQEFYLDEKVVILENEFGRINIDEETLGREGITVKPIQAGCICCSSSRDLFRGIGEIVNEYHPDRIIVEPTGIAKLSEIKKFLHSEEMELLSEIDHIITIVDAKNYYVRAHISKDFFEDQLRSSDIIFLSKTDQIDENKLEQAITDIRKVQPECLIIQDRWEDIDAEHLKDYMNYVSKNKIYHNKITMRKNLPNDFDRYEIVQENNINIEDMQEFIKEIEEGYYGEIHRVKGISRDTVKGRYSVDYIPGETIIKMIPIADLVTCQEKALKSDRDKIDHEIKELKQDGSDEKSQGGLIETSAAVDAVTKLCLIGRNLNRERLDTNMKL